MHNTTENQPILRVNIFEHPGSLPGDAAEAQKNFVLMHLPSVAPIIPTFLYDLVAPFLGKHTSKEIAAQTRQELSSRIGITRQMMEVTNKHQEAQLDKLNDQACTQGNPRWTAIRQFVSEWGAGCFDFNENAEHPLLISTSTDANGYFLLLSPKGMYYAKIKGPNYDASRMGGTFGETDTRLAFYADPKLVYDATTKLEAAIPEKGLDLANGQSGMYNTVFFERDRYQLSIKSLLDHGENSLTGRKGIVGSMMESSLQTFITTSELAALQRQNLS